MMLIYVIVAAAIPPLFYAPTPGMLAVFAFLFGIGLGGDYMIIPLMAAEMYGVAVMGRVMGVVLTADSVAESLVPMLVAGLRDRTGSYTGGFAAGRAGRGRRAGRQPPPLASQDSRPSARAQRLAPNAERPPWLYHFPPKGTPGPLPFPIHRIPLGA